MQLKRILTVLSLAAAFGTTSLAMQPTAEAGNACKRVKFKFKNEHRFNSKIKVTKVKVYDQGDGRWRTENVSDKECNQGSTCTTSGDNLTNLEQERITKIRFIYKYLEADGDWSDEVEGGDKVPSNPVCRADRTYGPFTITG